jgi:hypothetical protein
LEVVDMEPFLLASLAAGVWVVVSGLVMAATFGYRDMKSAFEAIGLSIPRGTGPFVTHAVVRVVMGMSVLALYAIFLRVFPATAALLLAAGFTWILSSLLPLAVIVEWGFFSWSLAAKVWAWSAGEFLIAAPIGRILYPR